MKPFAREVITPALLDILATTTSSAKMLHIATFGVSHKGSPPFGLPLLHCFSCSLKETKQSSCPLYAVRRVTVNQVNYYPLISRGRSPLDFTTVKAIYDTSIRVHLRSTPLLIPYKTSTYLPDGRQANA